MTTTDTSVVLSFPEARQFVEEYAARLSPTQTEMVSLLDALDLALAQDLRADRDFPPFPRATRDGYALRSAETSVVPRRLRVIGEVKAGGSLEDRALTAHNGEAFEIMTGAPVPDGCDAVVMVEFTTREGQNVVVQRSVQDGENVVAAGAEAKKGAVMLSRGSRINHLAVAIAAAVGQGELEVYRRPRVAILATGDELVDINLPPGPSEIRNSNSYSLAAQVEKARGEPVILPVARDDSQEISLLIRKGLESDLLLLSGGVSMGKYDLVESALHSMGAHFHFTGVRIQPGKPVVFGEVPFGDRVKPFFGLPGNPVSTMVTFQLFVRPVLDALSGALPQRLLFCQARLKSAFTTKTGLTRFLPARLDGNCTVELVRWQGSGDLMAVAQSNCYLVVPPEKPEFAGGELVTVLPF